MGQKVGHFGVPPKVKLQPTEHFFHEKSLFFTFWTFFLFRSLRKVVKIRTPFLTPFFAFFDSQKRGHFYPEKWAKNDVEKCHFFHVFTLGEKKGSKNGHLKSDQKVSKSALYTPIHPEGLDPFRNPLFDRVSCRKPTHFGSKRGPKWPLFDPFLTPFLSPFWAGIWPLFGVCG